MERLAQSKDVGASKKNIPLGRWGTVKEIADATVYLFSDAANYVSGQTLVGEFEPHGRNFLGKLTVDCNS